MSDLKPGEVLIGADQAEALGYFRERLYGAHATRGEVCLDDEVVAAIGAGYDLNPHETLAAYVVAKGEVTRNVERVELPTAEYTHG